MRLMLVIATLALVAAGCINCCQEVARPECATAQETSYHAHETDCASFYRCDDGHMTTFLCPYGLWYDEVQEMCHTVDSEVCNRCKHMVNESVEGQEETNWKPANVFAQSDLTTERVTPLRTTTERVTPVRSTTERVTPLRTTTESTTISVVITLPACPATPTCDAELGVEKPYPPNCYAYIVCGNGTAFDLSYCPDAEHFSPTELLCMSIELANCPVCVA